MGDIHIQLFKECAKTVENFCVHSKNNYYNGHIFHRVIKGEWYERETILKKYTRPSRVVVSGMSLHLEVGGLSPEPLSMVGSNDDNHNVITCNTNINLILKTKNKFIFCFVC